MHLSQFTFALIESNLYDGESSFSKFIWSGFCFIKLEENKNFL